jgi:hypothetical protein
MRRPMHFRCGVTEGKRGAGNQANRTTLACYDHARRDNHPLRQNAGDGAAAAAIFMAGMQHRARFSSPAPQAD